MKTQKIILLLGGNMGDIDKTISSAIFLINKNIGIVSSISNKYRTEAWGPIQQDSFLNVAIAVNTIFSPHIVLTKILAIEERLGRKRYEKYGPRIIDIDILFFGNRVISTKQLKVPHEQLPFRNFALVPCVDIIPNFIHPVLKKSIKELLLDTEDKLKVKEF